MDINIYDYINTATQKYYGTDVTPATAQELWAQFCAKISTPTKEYLAVISSTNAVEVHGAVSNLVQGGIAALVAEGESPPDFSSPEVQELIATLAEKFSTLRGQPELDGLVSTNASVVYSTLIALCSDLTLTQALTSLLTRASSTIAERGAALPTLYLDFLSQMIEAAKTSEATVALSPREEEVRRIMFEVFNLALEMIRVLQKSSTLQASLLYYYSKVQREYADMMSKTQMYGPTADYQIIADATDFGNTKLGYANVTVRSVVDSLMQQISTTTGATSATFQTTSYQVFDPTTGTYTSASMPMKFILSRSPDGGYSLVVQGYRNLPQTGTPPTGSYHTFMSTTRIGVNTDGSPNYSAANADVLTNLYYPSENLTGTQQTADVLNKLMYHLTRQWNETPDTYSGGTGYSYIIQYGATLTPFILHNFLDLKNAWSAGAALGWGNTGITGPIFSAYEKPKTDETPENIAAIRQRASAFRSEASSLLQIYMENSRALKDAAKEASKRSESVLTQLKEAIQNQSNFLSAITESLRGMLSAIFR